MSLAKVVVSLLYVGQESSSDLSLNKGLSQR
jgi:hypothetical protein